MEGRLIEEDDYGVLPQGESDLMLNEIYPAADLLLWEIVPSDDIFINKIIYLPQ